jgi:hypothetical protein
MTGRTYRIVYSQNDAGDHESAIQMPAVEAYELLSTSALLHSAFGWKVDLLGNGFVATKGEVSRREMIVPVELRAVA